MLNTVINAIKGEMNTILTENQMKMLEQVLTKHLSGVITAESEQKGVELLPAFIAAKRVEGCSEKSLRYYESTIRNMLEAVSKPRRSRSQQRTCAPVSIPTSAEERSARSHWTMCAIFCLPSFRGWKTKTTSRKALSGESIRSRPARRSKRHTRMSRWS